MEVLDERPLDRGQVVGGPDDRRDQLQAGSTGGPPPPFAGDELVGAVVERPHEHRLEHPDLSDRSGQFGERLLVEVDPRLQRVGQDAADRQLLQPGDVAGRCRGGIGGDQRPEALTKSAQARHH